MRKISRRDAEFSEIAEKTEDFTQRRDEERDGATNTQKEER